MIKSHQLHLVFTFSDFYSCWFFCRLPIIYSFLANKHHQFSSTLHRIICYITSRIYTFAAVAWELKLLWLIIWSSGIALGTGDVRDRDLAKSCRHTVERSENISALTEGKWIVKNVYILKQKYTKTNIIEHTISEYPRKICSIHNKDHLQSIANLAISLVDDYVTSDVVGPQMFIINNKHLGPWQSWIRWGITWEKGLICIRSADRASW